MGTSAARNSSLAAMLLGVSLPAVSQAEGFPSIARVAPGFGYYNVDKGFDDKLKFYGTVDAFVNYQDSGHYSGVKVAGGAAWTNKLGLYMRKAVDADTVLEADVEEGFNLNGKALDEHWKQVGALRLAVVALRSRNYGKLEFGKTYGMGTPTYADPFLATYGSPYTYLTSPPAGRGAYYLDLRPKHTLAYTTAKFAGFSLGSALSFGLNDTASSGKTLRGKGVSLQYSNAHWILIGSFNDYLSDPWDDGDRERQTHNYFKSASAFYDFGPLAASLTWQRQDVDYQATPSMTAWTVGIAAPVGKTDVARLSLVQRNIEFGNKDAFGMMLGYDHFLRPNWAIYGRVALIDNHPNSSISYAGIPIEQAGDDPQNLAIGMYYHF
ncbi:MULTISPECIES: porin [unclassified Pseudomonas]|uniref:porin n=1 Tax=unclassified Pseudomonas TaxID=196821 RepID=UPI00069E9178|nr:MULTISPECIES: porin [unclassified Pseudomonas]WPN45227.1 porin [Pseudomonas sp. P8_241]